MRLNLNDRMKIFALVFGRGVSAGMMVYGFIENAPILYTIGCISLVIQIICNCFIRR